MGDTAKLIDLHAGAPSHKKEYMATVREFYRAETEVEAATAIEKLREAHEAACQYFNFYEDLVGYSESLLASPAWLRKLADDCCVVLRSRLSHEKFLRSAAERLGIDAAPFAPDSIAYKRMQSLVARELPDKVPELREGFLSMALPVEGFDRKKDYAGKSRSSMSARVFYALCALVGLGAAGADGTYIVRHLAELREHTDEAYYVLLLVLGLACASFLFGVLRLTATVTGQRWGIAVYVGGPAAFAVLVVCGGFYLTRPPPTFDLTIRLVGILSDPPLGNTVVIVDTGQRHERKDVDSLGDTTMKQLTSADVDNPIAINVDSPNYEQVVRECVYRVGPQHVIRVHVRRIPVDKGSQARAAAVAALNDVISALSSAEVQQQQMMFPALQAYIDHPDVATWEAVREVSAASLKQLSAAVDAAVKYDASLVALPPYSKVQAAMASATSATDPLARALQGVNQRQGVKGAIVGLKQMPTVAQVKEWNAALGRSYTTVREALIELEARLEVGHADAAPTSTPGDAGTKDCQSDG